MRRVAVPAPDLDSTRRPAWPGGAARGGAHLPELRFPYCTFVSYYCSTICNFAVFKIGSTQLHQKPRRAAHGSSGHVF